MLRRLFALVAALVLITSMMPAPALASHTVTSWLGISASSSEGYHYRIPVCLADSWFGGGRPWDLDRPAHAAANRALGQWNSIGGELYFYRSNLDCTYLRNSGNPVVQLGKQDIDEMGTNDIDNREVCFEPWGNVCISYSIIRVDQSKSWSFIESGNTPSGYANLQYVIAHELGHVIHIEDEYNYTEVGDVMWHDFGVGEDWHPLTAHDKSNYIAHYGDEHCDETINEHPC